MCGTSPILKKKSQWQIREKIDSYSKALLKFTQRNVYPIKFKDYLIGAFNYFTGVKRSSILSSLGVKDAASQCLLDRDYRAEACPVAPADGTGVECLPAGAVQCQAGQGGGDID